MSIIKGTNQIVAGFGGTKRCIGEVYFSQSALATDNPGALPGWTGEYYENGKTLFPDLYNFVKAHSELQVTKAQYDSAIATYGECPKYVVDENASGGTGTAYKIRWAEPSVVISIIKSQTPQVGDIVYESEAFTEEPYDLSTATQYTIEAVSYSSSGSLSSITINSASMGVRTLTSVSVTGLPTVAGTSLRLPKYANYIKMANTSEGIKNIEAGLPNIDSDTNWINVTGGTETTATNTNVLSNKGAFGGTNSTGGHGIAGNNYPINWRRFDASLSNSIYGKSSTVTPASTTLYPWVVAYTAAIPASTAQAAQFQQSLSGKADTNLGNVPSNYDYVVETYNDGVNWYRKYKSGWLEQGGKSAEVAPNGNTIVTFSKAFANTTYTVLAQVCGGYTPAPEANAPITAQTETGFTIYSGSHATSTFNWWAIGQGAN